MSIIKPPPPQTTTKTTTLCICAVLLHFAGFIACSALPAAVTPDLQVPPLEFPSTSNKYIRIVEANNIHINQTPPLEFPSASTEYISIVESTPPLEFPSTSNKYIRIIEANNTTLNNLTKTLISSNGNNDKISIVEPTAEFQADIKRRLEDEILRSSSQPINVIARISENYTGNYIENKFYTNHIEENWSSITLTLLVLSVMAVIILGFSALCFKKVQNLKVSRQQLLQEECYDSMMSDLIKVQHV